ARRSGLALRLHAGHTAPYRAKIGAQASRRHVLRWFGGEGGRCAARRRGREAVRRRARANQPAHSEGAKGEGAMTLLFESSVKTTLILLFSLGAVWALRNRSASARHFVLAAGTFGAAVTPLIVPLVPAWPVAFPWSETLSSTLQPAQLTLSSSAPAAASITAVSSSASVDLTRGLLLIWTLGAAANIAALIVGVVRMSR